MQGTGQRRDLCRAARHRGQAARSGLETSCGTKTALHAMRMILKRQGCSGDVRAGHRRSSGVPCGNRPARSHGGGTSPIGPRTGLAAAGQTRQVLDAGADGGVTAGRTVRTAMAGQAAPEDYLNDTRAVLNGG